MKRSLLGRGVAVAALASGIVAGMVNAPAAVSAPVSPASARQVSTTAALQDAARLRPAQRVLASPKALTVAVLGDSVGNDPGEWVSMWAGNVATNRYVFVYHFDWQKQKYDPDVEVFVPSGDVTAEPIVVWNFGWPGGTPQRALDHLAVGVPSKPDLAIVAFGHNLAPSAVQRQYSALQVGMQARFGAVPTVTTLAHMTPVPRNGQAEGRAVLLTWLRSRNAPVIDERAVFDTAADPGQMFWDAVHPNVLGYRRIADLVTTQLSPNTAPPRPQCSRPSAAASKATGGRTVVTSTGRTTRVATTLRATDMCGKPLTNAWVKLEVRKAGAAKPNIISTQTDRRGFAAVEFSVPTGSVTTVTGLVTDGTTTVSVTPFAVRSGGA